MPKQRFSAKKVAELLREKLEENLDIHQRKGEFHDDCIQCQKCSLIRRIAIDLHQADIIRIVIDPTPAPRGKKVFTRGIHGERILLSDTDMRVRGRTRAGDW